MPEINLKIQIDPLDRKTINREDTNFRLMRILHDNPDITQRELAQQLGVSSGALNYCLSSLKEKGMVKMRNFKNSKNKFGYVYLLTPAGITEKSRLTSSFLKRKMDEFESLRLEIESIKSELAEETVSESLVEQN